MRVQPKPAAASAAAAFFLLLLFSLTWPGHGAWLLILGVALILTSGTIWWRNRIDAAPNTARSRNDSPFANVSAYGLAGPSFRAVRRPVSGLPISVLLGPIGALAILLFIGGAIGSEGSVSGEAEATLRDDVTAIDRSGDGDAATSRLSSAQLQPPQAVQSSSLSGNTVGTEVSPPANANLAESGQSSQTNTVVRPIVVAAPKPASAAAEDAEDDVALPQSANTFEYVVEDGDTLYDIAERYGTTVNKLMELNSLDSFSFIHPGDVLLVPRDADEGEQS